MHRWCKPAQLYAVPSPGKWRGKLENPVFKTGLFTSYSFHFLTST